MFGIHLKQKLKESASGLPPLGKSREKNNSGKGEDARQNKIQLETKNPQEAQKKWAQFNKSPQMILSP